MQTQRQRGALSQIQGRFETEARDAFDDGWARDDEPLEPLRTTVTVERARSIISKNDSPDIPFDQSINPYRGCEHGCIYCMAGDTKILMADGTTKPLAEVRTGDTIYGTVRKGWFRRYARTKVLAQWSVIKPAYRVTLEDGTTLVAGGDHRFLTERGWKFVTDVELQRPHLTTNNKLMGTGAFAESVYQDANYQLGYLSGMIRGDGHLRSYSYDRPGRANGDQHHFRLALCDEEALARTEEYLADWGIATRAFVFQEAAAGRRAMHAIRASARVDVADIRELVDWPRAPTREWAAGFLAGIFDAEGSYSDWTIRISNTDRGIISRITQCLEMFAFRCVIEHTKRGQTRPMDVVRVLGGLREHFRFFHTMDPAITRKRDISGVAVKSDAQVKVVGIEPLGKTMRLYDITTGTEDFIANGVVSHNCYARPSHSYLELSPGLDFETKLFAKTNAAELLKGELAKPGYVVSPISLGANTDCYQPAERKFGITRQILEVLSGCDHPLTIVTKSALVERDLDLLAPMARKNLVKVYLSIGTLDPVLARKLEPRAASPKRRLDTLRALSAAGVPCGVMVAALIPALSDKTLEHVLEEAAKAGAQEAAYVILRLPNELKGIFKEWLAAHYPERADHVISIVRQMRGGKDNDSTFGERMRGTGNFAELISKRFAIACKRFGLNGHGGGRRTPALDCTRFVPPSPAGQMKLF
jgi:DNA repair photolyase